MNVDFYKELHLRELSRKKELDDAIITPIGLITIIAGMLSFFINEGGDIVKNNCIILILFSSIVFTLIISICLIVRSINNFVVDNSYSYLSLPDELLQYENDLKLHNTNTSIGSDKIDFEEYLKENFAKIATENKIVNDRRGESIYYAKNWLVVSIFISLILMFFYLFIKF